LQNQSHDLIVVLDFGAQYSQLIARRIRECRVYCEVWPYHATYQALKECKVKGIILSGGPGSIYSPGAPVCEKEILDGDIPVLGICYGMQLMADHFGGSVAPAPKGEYGRAKVRLATPVKTPLFKGIDPDDEGLDTWMSHTDQVKTVPSGFKVIASSENAPVAAMAHDRKALFGLQFHPEVVHTCQGPLILKNFVTEICGCRPTWTMERFIEQKIEEIQSLVGTDQKAICALSGGVDSTVAATLVHKALGSRFKAVFVDHGFMRKDEPEHVVNTLSAQFGSENLLYVDAKDRFLKALRKVKDPEKKRKIIGEEFIRVFEQQAKQLGEIDYLVQGTIYPDVIESGNSTASLIKSHHNVGGLPEKMGFKLIEPLKMLFKDEVRLLGKELGLPEKMVERAPFPGPGLAIRVIGEITEEKLAIERECDAIVTQELERAGLDKKLWQYFVVLTQTRSVGVKGDNRTYGYVVAIRAVTSVDGMTADWARIPYEVLEKMAGRMMNEVSQVGRVVYDISSKPPATIEWE
jgi:GMP synthase (glutamine-hydrolysing)